MSKSTDLKVCIDGRKWLNCDGKVNFPDGEVYTSPVDDKINGVISFSFPGIYAGKEIEGIKMEIEDMLCDMREGGQIYADGELFHENGKFIDAVLNK